MNYLICNCIGENLQAFQCYGLSLSISGKREALPVGAQPDLIIPFLPFVYGFRYLVRSSSGDSLDVMIIDHLIEFFHARC